MKFTWIASTWIQNEKNINIFFYHQADEIGAYVAKISVLQIKGLGVCSAIKPSRFEKTSKATVVHHRENYFVVNPPIILNLCIPFSLNFHDQKTSY
jgi:hypothetical protein